MHVSARVGGKESCQPLGWLADESIQGPLVHSANRGKVTHQCGMLLIKWRRSASGYCTRPHAFAPQLGRATTFAHLAPLTPSRCQCYVLRLGWCTNTYFVWSCACMIAFQLALVSRGLVLA